MAISNCKTISNYQIGFLGGDKRQLYLARLLSTQNKIVLFGFSEDAINEIFSQKEQSGANIQIQSSSINIASHNFYSFPIS